MILPFLSNLGPFRKTIDVIIGTFCIENNINLLYHDRDFNPLEKIYGIAGYYAIVTNQ